MKTKRRVSSKRKVVTRQNGIKLGAVVLLAVLACLAVYLVINALTNETDVESTPVPQPIGKVAIEVHSINQNTGEMEFEVRHINDGGEGDMLNDALGEWLSVFTAFSPSAVYMGGGVARVIFGEALAGLTPLEETFVNMSLVFTLTSLDFIGLVEIYLGDEKRGEFDRSWWIVETTPTEVVTVTLYFGDINWQYMMAEERVIEWNTNKQLEVYIVNELIRGSAYGHIRTIPSDVALINVQIENDVCIVNFNTAFKPDGGSLGEMFMVYSIVNSLTELEHINEVLFWVNNALITEEMGFELNLGNPIARDESLFNR
jgi:hypothetical protein